MQASRNRNHPRISNKHLSWIILALLCLAGASARPGYAQAGGIGRQSNPIVFGVIGDFGSGEPQEADVANLVKGWDPDFIVTVGDNNYPIGAAYSIDQNIGQYYHEYIYPYKGQYGAGASSRNFYPALGNHDWMSNEARPYFNYFSFHNEVGYYDFVRGPLHFFILDSDPHEPDGMTAGSKQGKWLKSGLASSSSAFNVVVMHHPPYSSGQHGSTVDMQWPFKSWGADVVLSGHDHLYERIIVDGFLYFVNGIGGESLYTFASAVPGSQARFGEDYGAMRVEATSTYMKFQAWTRAGVLVDEYTIGDNTPAVTSIRRTDPDPSNAAGLGFTVTFSEPVTGVDASDFSLSATGVKGASISHLSGSGNTYVVSINSGIGDGSLRLDLVDDDSIVGQAGDPLGGSSAGNGNFATGESYAIDKTPPGVTSIVRASLDPSNAESVDFTVAFSESVSGVDAADFTPVSAGLSGVSIGGIAGSANSYTVSVNTGSGADSLRLDLVDNRSIADAAGNKLGGLVIGNGDFSGGESYMIDKLGPTVSSITRASPNPSGAPHVDFLVTFSEPVTGLDGSDFIMATDNITGASILAISGSGPAYVVTVSTGVGTGAFRLDLIDDDSISDLLGNKAGGPGVGNGNFSGGEFYTIDKSAPKVLAITRADPNPSGAPSLDVLVTFSQPVTGVDATDFSLGTENVTGALVTNVSGSENLYRVTVTTGSGDGMLRVDLTDDDSIVNAGGIPLGDIGAGNGNFVGGEDYSINKGAPRLTSIIRASPNPTAAASVDFIVTFSESVTGVDASDFGLTGNGVINAAVSSLTSADPFYVITVTTGMGTGTIRLDLLDDDSISNAAGNHPGGPGLHNGDFMQGEAFDIAKASVNFPPPSIIGLRRNIVTNNPTPIFAWTLVRGARGYEINVASDGSFTQLVASQVISQSTYTMKEPLRDGIYFWRVRAYNSELQPGKFSYSQQIMIDTTPPPIPTLLSPGDNAAVATKVTLQWAAISEAVLYEAQVDNNSDFSSPEFLSSKADTSIRPSGLRKGVYFWRVRAKDMAGNWSNWAAPFVFTFK